MTNVWSPQPAATQSTLRYDSDANDILGHEMSHESLDPVILYGHITATPDESADSAEIISGLVNAAKHRNAGMKSGALCGLLRFRCIHGSPSWRSGQYYIMHIFEACCDDVKAQGGPAFITRFYLFIRFCSFFFPFFFFAECMQRSEHLPLSVCLSTADLKHLLFQRRCRASTPF